MDFFHESTSSQSWREIDTSEESDDIESKEIRDILPGIVTENANTSLPADLIDKVKTLNINDTTNADNDIQRYITDFYFEIYICPSGG